MPNEFEVMNMPFCVNCGNEVSPNSSFCTACGARINSSQYDNSAHGNTWQGKTTKVDLVPPATPTAPQTGWRSQPAQTAGSATSNRLDTAAIAIVIAALVLVAAAIIVFVFVLGNHDDTYTVSFETAGGTTISAYQTEARSMVTSPADPKKEGYTFEGWYEDKECTRPASFPLDVDKNIVLYAKWNPVKEQAESKTSTKTQDTSTRKYEESTSKPVTTPSKENIVQVTFVGNDGTRRTERIRRQGSSERVIPDSNSRALSASEVSALTEAERCIAWNEIIASSNGYVFKNSGLKQYFNNCSWYYPRSGADPGGNLSSVAAGNVKLLQDKTGSWWKSLRMS